MTPERPVTIFVHGYCADERDVVIDMERISAVAGPGQPYHVVGWIWPAKHFYGRGVVNNLDDKIQKARAQAYYLARLICELDPGIALSLVGHSFGTRPITGALHGLATGQIDADALPASHAVQRQLQLTMLASANESPSLRSGGPSELALTQADRTAATFNPDDRTLHVMAHYLGRNDLVGLRGIEASVPRRGPLYQWTVSSSVGGHHTVTNILKPPSIAAALRPFMVYRDRPTLES
jgi:hypothetical protein